MVLKGEVFGYKGSFYPTMDASKIPFSFSMKPQWYNHEFHYN